MLVVSLLSNKQPLLRIVNHQRRFNGSCAIKMCKQQRQQSLVSRPIVPVVRAVAAAVVDRILFVCQLAYHQLACLSSNLSAN